MVKCKDCMYSRPLDNGAFECQFNPPHLYPLPGPPTLENPGQGSIQITPLRPQVPAEGTCGRGEPEESQIEL